MNPWVVHIRNFASRNKLSYGCAMTDPRCKKEYQDTKKNASRNPVKFVPTTKKQNPIKTITKTETFKKNLNLESIWEYKFGNKKQDIKFRRQFKNKPTTYKKLKKKRKYVRGYVYRDEKDKPFYTIELDNYLYDDIEDIDIVFDEGYTVVNGFKMITFDKDPEVGSGFDSDEEVSGSKFDWFE
jgi:hypothetical protein|tara:strand:- start:37 stop:585 length:549 start_codon:yes stop_codon:yes gene_type:complete